VPKTSRAEAIGGRRQRVVTGDVKYGAHAYDQWSVDELLARVMEYCKRSRPTLEAA
jgi:hypothetical protein